MGFILDDVRCSLIGIENPDYLSLDEKIIFKKDSDGFADKDLISMLHESGVTHQLYAARQLKNQRLETAKK